MSQRTALFAVTIAVAAATAPARAEQPIGLREALKRAVLGNRQLALEAIDVAISEAQIVQAAGSFDLLLSGRGDYSHSESGLFGTRDDLTTSLSLSRRLPSNGTLALRGEYQRSEVDANLGGAPFQETDHVTSAVLSLSQPLLRGFGRPIATAERRRAEAQRDIDTLDRRARAAQIVRDIVAGYWDLAYSTRNIAIRRSAVELAREQLRITRAQVDVGRLAPVDAVAVERAIAQREEELALAEAEAVQRSVALRRAIGMPLEGEDPTLVAADQPETATAPVELGALIERARRASPQLQAARRAGDRAAIDVEVTDRGLLPQLDLSGFLGPTGASTESGALAEDAGDALSRMANFEDLTYGAGVVLNVPLGNRAARGAHRAAELSLRRARLGAEEIEQQITEALIVAATQVRTAAKRIEVTRVASRFSGQTLKAERSRFDVGRATNFNVLERQEELRDSQLREVQAAVDYLKSIAALEALTGEILDRYGIDLRSARR